MEDHGTDGVAMSERLTAAHTQRTAFALTCTIRTDEDGNGSFREVEVDPSQSRELGD